MNGVRERVHDHAEIENNDPKIDPGGGVGVGVWGFAEPSRPPGTPPETLPTWTPNPRIVH